MKSVNKPETRNTTLETNKSQLARLMAAEKITVQHHQIRTAKFDLKNRVLHCPIWTDMTGSIYDLLMGHEISHAIHTPMMGWHDAIANDKQRKNIKQFLNVIEDARIERLIKIKYPGLRKSFIEAYQQLFDRDLFKIKKLRGDYSKLKFIDRINVHFKLGAHANVKFNDVEQDFVDRIAVASTWQEVEILAREVYDYSKVNSKPKDQPKNQPKQPKQKQPKDQDQDEQDQSDDSETDPDEDQGEQDAEDDQSDDSDESAGDTADEESDPVDEADGQSAGEDGEDGEDETDEQEEGTSSNGVGGSDEKPVEPESETDQAFREAEDTLINTAGQSIYYTNIPNANLDAIVVPHKKVIEMFERCIAAELRSKINGHANYDVIALKLASAFHRRNKGYIGLLVKEFEMKKNASQYARQLQSKTGELDAQKMSRYRFTNDIFRKVTTVSKGKNHGMIIYLDLSGSMEKNLRAVIEQLLILVTFCKRVGIPFDAYGFGDKHKYAMPFTDKFSMGVNEFQFPAARDFNLRHLISSDMKGNAFKRAFNMLNVLGQLSLNSDRDINTINSLPVSTMKVNTDALGFQLNGTPYIQTLIASRDMIERFKSTHHVEVMNVVYLTDGDGDRDLTLPSEYYTMTVGTDKVTLGFEDARTKKRVLCDDKLGFLKIQSAVTELITEITGAKHIGFYFCHKSELDCKIIDNYKLKQHKIALEKQFDDDGHIVVPNLGYSSYYYLDIVRMNYTGGLSINSRMPDAEMARHFNQHQKAKMSGKLVAKHLAGEMAA